MTEHSRRGFFGRIFGMVVSSAIADRTGLAASLPSLPDMARRPNQQGRTADVLLAEEGGLVETTIPPAMLNTMCLSSACIPMMAGFAVPASWSPPATRVKHTCNQPFAKKAQCPACRAKAAKRWGV